MMSVPEEKEFNADLTNLESIWTQRIGKVDEWRLVSDCIRYLYNRVNDQEEQINDLRKILRENKLWIDK